MISLILLLIGIVIITFYYYRTFNYWKRRGVKTLTPNLFFGNLTGVVFRRTPVYEMFKELYATCKKNGDKFMGFYYFNMPSLVITDLELMKQILTKDFAYFTDRPFYLNEEDPLTINIASAKGNQWKKMREQLSPAFSPSKLKYIYQTLLQVGDQLKSTLDILAENYEVVNLKDICSRYMVDVTGMSIFGIECNTLKNLNPDFKEVAENTFGGNFIQNIKMTLSLQCPSLLQFYKIPFNSLKIQNFYLNLVNSTVEYREKNNIVRNDLMHSLIQLRNNIDIDTDNNFNLVNVSEKKQSLNIEEITAQVIIFFGAAYETTASVISLCIYELASNEEVQNNLREEIVSVLEQYDGKLTYDALMEMTYLDKCITETLRKYALSSTLTRLCTKKYKLPDTDIELDVGTMLYVPVYEFHRDPQYYPNPDKFDPERFSVENKAKRSNFTFLSFGEGPRNCIGLRLSGLQTKIFLVTFLKNYNFTINSKVKLPPTLGKSNMIISFENPLYLNISKV